MAINRIDLLNHRFSRSIRGYDPEEVDLYLQEISDTLARTSEERVRLANRIAELENRLSEFIQRENALRDTMLATQKMSEGIKAQAQKEAQIILDAAQVRAEGISRQAELRLARILEDIADARKLKAQFEFNVRSVIEGHLKLLELGQKEDARLEKATEALTDRPRATRQE